MTPTADRLPTRERLRGDVARARRVNDPAQQCTPISALEPCEVCGVDVVGVEHEGRRAVVEPLRMSRESVPDGADYRLMVRRHRCGGRRAR